MRISKYFVISSIFLLTACQTNTPVLSLNSTGTLVIPQHDKNKEVEIYNKVFSNFENAYNNISYNDRDIEIISTAKAEGELLLSGTFLPYFASYQKVYNLRKYIDNFSTSSHNILFPNINYIYTNEFIYASDIDAINKMQIEAGGDTSKFNPTIVKEYLKSKNYTLNENPGVIRTDLNQMYIDINNIFSFPSSLFVSGNEFEPGLAKSYRVSEDKKTYTFQLYDDLYYVDYLGQKQANIKADDFVFLKEYANKYFSGINYNSEVNVKALSDYEVQYTFSSPIDVDEAYYKYYDYFIPLNREHFSTLTENAKKSILRDPTFYKERWYYDYFYLNNFDEHGVATFIKNPYTHIDGLLNKYTSRCYREVEECKNNINLYNFDAINNNYIFKAEYIKDGKNENSKSLYLSSIPEEYKKYIYEDDISSSKRFIGLNLYDGTQQYQKAILDRDFRLALLHSINRESLADKDYQFYNILSKANQVYLYKDTTYNNHTFNKGTSYGDIVQYFVGDEIEVRENQDGWYNVELAQNHMLKAVENLGNQLFSSPITIYLENLIYNTTYQRLDSIEKSIEESLTINGKKYVDIKLVPFAPSPQDYMGYQHQDVEFRKDIDLMHQDFTLYYQTTLITNKMLKLYLSERSQYNDNSLYKYNGFYEI